MGFLKDADYADLPEDDGDAFAYLESVARERLFESDRYDGNLAYDEIMEFMNEVSALADHFEIPDISYDREANNAQVELGAFMRSVEYRTVQIKINRARREKRNSVELSGPARKRIQHHLEKLKSEIAESDLPEKRKRALLEKIADFEAELAKKRFNMIVAFGMVALVAATVSDTGSSFEHLSKLAHLISSEFGEEKAVEEEKLLPPSQPFKALPDMSPKGRSDSGKVQLANLEDDEIPF